MQPILLLRVLRGGEGGGREGEGNFRIFWVRWIRCTKYYLSKIMFAGLVEVLFSTDLWSVRMKVVFGERKTGMSRAGPCTRTLEFSRTVYRNSLTACLIFVELWSIRRTTNFLFICTCVKISLSQSEEQCLSVWRTGCQGRHFRPKWQKVQQDAENCTVIA
jgi:hypothetical protein